MEGQRSAVLDHDRELWTSLRRSTGAVRDPQQRPLDSGLPPGFRAGVPGLRAVPDGGREGVQVTAGVAHARLGAGYRCREAAYSVIVALPSGRWL
jgi:hypothetical protein